MEISFFVKCPDGRYERFHETHRQRLWEKGELSALIEGAGFENVQCLDEGDRIYFWAKKPV